MAKRAQHVAPNNVGICWAECCDRLAGALDGVVDADDLPSASQINKRTRRDLVMSKKKLSVLPSESNTPEQIARQDEYLNVISTFKPHQIHFFDEASVIKTTGNRSYGNATVGEKAIEFQRYPSNANFTVNLFHSTFWRRLLQHSGRPIQWI